MTSPLCINLFEAGCRKIIIQVHQSLLPKMIQSFLKSITAIIHPKRKSILLRPVNGWQQQLLLRLLIKPHLGGMILLKNESLNLRLPDLSQISLSLIYK